MKTNTAEVYTRILNIGGENFLFEERKTNGGGHIPTCIGQIIDQSSLGANMPIPKKDRSGKAIDPKDIRVCEIGGKRLIVNIGDKVYDFSERNIPVLTDR